MSSTSKQNPGGPASDLHRQHLSKLSLFIIFFIDIWGCWNVCPKNPEGGGVKGDVKTGTQGSLYEIPENRSDLPQKKKSDLAFSG
jgi:hypothetical protein